MDRPDIAQRALLLRSKDNGVIPDGHGSLWQLADLLRLRIGSHIPRSTSYGSDDNKTFRLEDCSPGLANVLSQCLWQSRDERNLTRAVRNQLELVAGHFVRDGSLTYELCGQWGKEKQAGQFDRVWMLYIRPDSLELHRGTPRQVVPSGEEGQDSPGRQIELDPKRVVTFRPPSHCQRSLDRLRASLPVLWRSESEWMLDIGAARSESERRTTERNYALQWAKLTAPIGWHAHQRYNKHISSYLVPIYELRWQRFCIQVRDAILNTLAEAFTIIGSWVGEKPRLVWDGLPTVAMVDEAEARVAAGEVGFLEAMKPFWRASSID
jgi:hypothetical protein